jgi:transglutaminase-like putative cysteine protease
MRYAGTARESVNEARLIPRSGPRQTVERAAIAVIPEAPIRAHRDAWGNEVRWFQVVAPHDALIVEAEALVEVRPAQLAAREAAWAELGDPGYLDALAESLAPSTYVRWGDEVGALAAELGIPEGDGVLAWLDGVEVAVHAAVAYRRGETLVDTPVERVARARAGVCQDMAHLTIALLRRRGVAARYVSGWLHQPASEGPGESHAWLEAFVPGTGWLELDPTHPGEVGDHHVRLAVGRDYADAAPIRGTYVGDETASLSVTVEIREGVAANLTPDAGEGS